MKKKWNENEIVPLMNGFERKISLLIIQSNMDEIEIRGMENV